MKVIFRILLVFVSLLVACSSTVLAARFFARMPLATGGYEGRLDSGVILLTAFFLSLIFVGNLMINRHFRSRISQ
jgi:hypothetical protein